MTDLGAWKCSEHVVQSPFTSRNAWTERSSATLAVSIHRYAVDRHRTASATNETGKPSSLSKHRTLLQSNRISRPPNAEVWRLKIVQLFNSSIIIRVTSGSAPNRWWACVDDRANILLLVESMTIVGKKGPTPHSGRFSGEPRSGALTIGP